MFLFPFVRCPFMGRAPSGWFRGWPSWCFKDVTLLISSPPPLTGSKGHGPKTENKYGRWLGCLTPGEQTLPPPNTKVHVTFLYMDAPSFLCTRVLDMSHARHLHAGALHCFLLLKMIIFCEFQANRRSIQIYPLYQRYRQLPKMRVVKNSRRKSTKVSWTSFFFFFHF